MAQYYIALTEGRDPITTNVSINSATWRLPYEHASYNPAPPFILKIPQLQVYVTKAYAPGLTVEQFRLYRENMKKKIKNRGK